MKNVPESDRCFCDGDRCEWEEGGSAWKRVFGPIMAAKLEKKRRKGEKAKAEK